MLGGGGYEAVGGRRTMMPSFSSPPVISASGKGREEKVSLNQNQPQWGNQETKEFIEIRAELENDFTAAKRNKTLWEIVSMKMLERGYRRSPDQCKCKWKNLVNRYKGKEISDPEDGRQFPFFEELQAVFSEREKNMQGLLVDSEVISSHANKKLKGLNRSRSWDELSEDENDDDEERRSRSSVRKKKTTERNVLDKSQRLISTSNNVCTDIHEILNEFFEKQKMMDVQWREMVDKRAQERVLFEEEWRQSMEKLERERLMVERAWRDKEEQRRIREENRAERRDALLTALLDKLINENQST